MRGMFPKGFDIVKYQDEDGDLVSLLSESFSAMVYIYTVFNIGNRFILKNILSFLVQCQMSDSYCFDVFVSQV